MRILMWHVHGSWTSSFVQGNHTYLLPVVEDRGPEGRGRARTWNWPTSAVEVTPEDLAATDIDVIVLQRPIDEDLADQWLGGRKLGRDVPVVWLEHNAPQGRVADMRHTAADRRDVTVVHVTHTNELFWDCGTTPTRVIEHGIPDPGDQYSGELPHAAVVVNEPERRGRVVGADLLPRFAEHTPIDMFGMATATLADRLGFGGEQDLDQPSLHQAMARRRVYLHPFRWTSLGLSLLEAMSLGMPIVALATTEVPESVPSSAGVVTNRLDDACAALRHFINEPEAARRAGQEARRSALERFGLKRFLDDWDVLLSEVVAT
jgi:hypothetical protein